MEIGNLLESDNQLEIMLDEGASKIGSTSTIFDTDNTQTTIDTFDNEIEFQWSYEPEIGNFDGENEILYDNELAIEDERTINEPYIGMEFGSADEVKNFYNIYAFKTGFSIRKSTHYKSKKFDNMISTIVFTCSKEGQPNQPTYKGDENVVSEVKSTPKKEMPYRRTGCKAFLRARMVEQGKWVVSKFHNEHNHELIVSPSKSRFGRSHRKITKDQREIIHQLSEQNQKREDDKIFTSHVKI
ncbi:Protein FAR1-RELATED SEQUENCE 12 [Ananas comosus]|uniref:Protein FAR1-RELATED SEQUENCE 12 n=1 Tax=Ananas comosus TaxID=4615 RepID=A0A199VKB0_ANACO|nr:Protein FAR1-RELATED SEQUENCE 12 [Ananas comosus]